MYYEVFKEGSRPDEELLVEDFETYEEAALFIWDELGEDDQDGIEPGVYWVEEREEVLPR